jgi:hypothetical protein
MILYTGLTDSASASCMVIYEIEANNNEVGIRSFLKKLHGGIISGNCEMTIEILIS